MSITKSHGKTETITLRIIHDFGNWSYISFVCENLLVRGYVREFKSLTFISSLATLAIPTRICTIWMIIFFGPLRLSQKRFSARESLFSEHNQIQRCKHYSVSPALKQVFFTFSSITIQHKIWHTSNRYTLYTLRLAIEIYRKFGQALQKNPCLQRMQKDSLGRPLGAVRVSALPFFDLDFCLMYFTNRGEHFYRIIKHNPILIENCGYSFVFAKNILDAKPEWPLVKKRAIVGFWCGIRPSRKLGLGLLIETSVYCGYTRASSLTHD